MKSDEVIRKRLARLQSIAERCARIYEKELVRANSMTERALAELEQERNEKKKTLDEQAAKIAEEINQAGKDFAKKKYQLERDYASNKDELHKCAEELQGIHKRCEAEMNRVKEEKVNLQVSYERQRGALRDIYEEKRRHLSVTSGKLLEEWKVIDGKLSDARARYEQDIERIEREGKDRIGALNEQAAAKRQGWETALESMKRELESLTQEKAHLEKQLSEVKNEKEKELESVKLGMSISKEQLEIDKASLIEKAEEEQRRAEADVQQLRSRIEQNEKDLQSLVLSRETQKKDLEEGFQREEDLLRETVKIESEKRDYEQKIFEQEKAMKEKEVARLREEYDKKKWQWDNQIRTLMMQKSVQDAEHEADRLRVDREARVALRGLEAQRDELKQRLADLKSRHEGVSSNAKKEEELIQQRWRWRKDRLWTMWQNRLDILRKERAVLSEQIDQLQLNFKNMQAQLQESKDRDTGRINNLEGFVMQMSERGQGQQKQREIQLELEKTRIVAQIKETELLVSDWMDRLKHTQEEVAAHNQGLVAQINYLDRWSREEEKETELFLHTLQKAVSVLDSAMQAMNIRNAA